MNAQEFLEVVGYEPEQDDLERANCEKAGEVGHTSCGICPVCGKPNFVCLGHELATLRAQNEAQAEVIEKLREALKPFAGLRVDGLNDKVLIYTETSTKQLEGVFTVGEVRQARTILKETEQK